MNKIIKNIFIPCFCLFTSIQAYAGPLKVTPIQPVPVLQLNANTPFVENINVSSSCTANYQASDVKLDANLVLPTSALGGTNKPLIYMWIDGVPSEPVVGTIYNVPSTIDKPKSGISASFTKNLTGNSGKTKVQFSLGLGGVKSSLKEVNYSCINLVAPAPQPVIGVVSRPNFKTLPIVAIFYSPPVELANPNPPPKICIWFNCWETRVSLGNPIIALVETDLSRTLPVHRILFDKCPANGDANLTLSFVIAVEAKGANLEGYIGESYYKDTFPYQGSPILVQGGLVLDSRNGRNTGIKNLPDGHEWAIFDRVVKCSSDTVIHYKVDPENKLVESDETDNVISFRISTIKPQ